jgi:bifunctional non-homologous end joining protein LigD
LAKRLTSIEVDECPLMGEVPAVSRGRRWVRPELVVEVEYLEWTPAGHLRMPIFRKLLSGVEPQSCQSGPPRDPLAPREGVADADATAWPEAESEWVDARGSALEVEQPPTRARASGRVQLSNLDKVFWPEEGYTKGEMLDYYARVSPALLPHLRDRPIMLVRYPDGITGKNFYQWNVPVGTPDWIRCLELRHEERDGKKISTFLVDDLDSLLHVVNLGCIPLHVLACRQQSLEHCQFLTIDFDLGGRPFSDAVQLGLGLRELLLEVGLQGFPKTSGQTGLHVFIPLGEAVPFAAAKLLNELIGVQLQRRFRELSTVERRISERKGRVYIDTGQTGRSRTIVAPYSVRAYPGATVSTPLHWEELHLALRPSGFTMFNVPDRVAEIGDPMAQMYDTQPDIVEAVARLENLMRAGE